MAFLLAALELNPAYLAIGLVAFVLIFALKAVKKVVKILLGIVAAFAVYCYFFGNPLF
ncbi:MAG: hypothetical protein MJ062_05375 [Oscillospiraceae bacterium]|nr:hypothetical protein [Oscillospiraceae bacterium]